MSTTIDPATIDLSRPDDLRVPHFGILATEGSPVREQAQEVRDLERRFIEATVKVRGLLDGRDAARAEDDAAYGKALRAGKAAPGTKAQDALAQQINETARAVGGLREAWRQADRDLNDAVHAKRDEYLAALQADLDARVATYRDAYEGAAAALSAVRAEAFRYERISAALHRPVTVGRQAAPDTRYAGDGRRGLDSDSGDNAAWHADRPTTVPGHVVSR